jgi:hypothetical protein
MAVLAKPARGRLCVLLALLILTLACTLVWLASGSVTRVPTAVVVGPTGPTVETKTVPRIPRSAAAQLYGWRVPVFFIQPDGTRAREFRLTNQGNTPTGMLVCEVPARVEWKGSSYSVRSAMYTILGEGGVWGPGEGQTVELTAEVVYEPGEVSGLWERWRWFWRRVGDVEVSDRLEGRGGGS